MHHGITEWRTKIIIIKNQKQRRGQHKKNDQIGNVLTNNGFSFITIMQNLAAIFKTFRPNAFNICQSQFLY